MKVGTHRRATATQSGFTIIEVLIVLAIAALVMMILFFAIPAVKRSARNYERKDYASIAYAGMDDFKANSGHFPGSLSTQTTAEKQAEICSFLQTLPHAQPGTACTHNTASSTGLNGSVAADCADLQAGPYTVCYQDWTTLNHGYIGPTDEFSIVLGHWCNVAPNVDTSQPSTFPIAGNDTDLDRFAVWTTLEGFSKPLCLDNKPG